MKKNSLIPVTLIAISCLAGSLRAQETIPPTTGIQALEGLMPLNPLNLPSEQGSLLDLGDMKEVYFEDGEKLTNDKIVRFLVETDYILIPYVKPSDKNKMVAALIRKATSEEREAQKAIRKKMEMPLSADDIKAGLGNDPETNKMTDFDPNLKRDDYIKGLQQLPSNNGVRFVNPGKVPHFDENGNLIPLLTSVGNRKTLNPEFQRYFTNRDLIQVAYADEKGEIKAIVYRRATEEEKRNRKQLNMMVSMQGREGKPAETAVASAPAFGSSDSHAIEIGRKFMDFSSKDIEGKDITLSQYKGKKAVVLNFWFTHCSPCKKEMPLLNKLVDQYRGKEVEFISLCDDNIAAINDFLKKQEFKYRIVPDAAELANLYKVEGYPTHIVIDKNSTVTFFRSGFSYGIENEISAAVNKCLK